MDFSWLWSAFLSALPIILGGGVVVGLMWWFNRHPDSKFLPYYGLAIQAVRFAEKAIPDDTENKSLKKADMALEEFIRVYEENTGKTANDALQAWFMRVKEIILIELAKK